MLTPFYIILFLGTKPAEGKTPNNHYAILLYTASTIDPSK